MTRNRDSHGMYKAQMNDGDHYRPNQQLRAERRAERARLSEIARRDAEAFGQRMQVTAVKPAGTERVDIAEKNRRRMELWRQKVADGESR